MKLNELSVRYTSKLLPVTLY